MRKDGTLIELHEERPVARACGNVLNLMADMEPGEIASMLAPTLLPEANDDFWLQSTNYMLTVAVIALRAAKLPVTFSSLHALFVAGPARLVGLAKKLDPESEAGKVLTVFLDGVGANGEVIRDNSWSSQFSVMSHAFRRLAAREWVHTLFSDATGAQGLFSMLQQRKCIVIEGPERSSGQAEKTILSGLRSALSRRLQASREEGEQGWVFGFSEVDKYQSPALYRMVEQGRGARAAFLCTSEDARNLSPEIRANVWNQLHLRGVNPELLAKLTEMIATRPVLLQPHRVTMSNYWDA
jgi:hypothetical protein